MVATLNTATPTYAGRLHLAQTSGEPLLEAAQPLLRALRDTPAALNASEVSARRQWLLNEAVLFERVCSGLRVPRFDSDNARYCLCSALDEAAMQTEWGRGGATGSEWNASGLATSLGYDRQGADRVFALMEMALRDAEVHRDLIAVLQEIVASGFRGRYRFAADGHRRLDAMRARLAAANTSANTCAQGRAQAPHQDAGTVRGVDAQASTHRESPKEITSRGNAERVHQGSQTGAQTTGSVIETAACPRGASGRAPLTPDDIVDVKYRESAQTIPVGRRWFVRARWFVAGAIATALLAAFAYRLHTGSVGRAVTPASPLADIVHAIEHGLPGEIAHHGITLRANADMSSLVILVESMFGPGQSTLTPTSAPLIAQIGRTLAAAGARVQIRLTGYTDNVVPEPMPGVSNLSLSTQRAQAVMQALILAGVAPGRMSADGQGETSPLDDNRTREGRARNRRVEIIVEPTP